MTQSYIIYLGFGYKGLVFCRHNGWLMEKMDSQTVPKWVLIVWPKIPQMPFNLSAQFVTQAQKFEIAMKKGFIGRP
jgi:hypothetical protein